MKLYISAVFFLFGGITFGQGLKNTTAAPIEKENYSVLAESSPSVEGMMFGSEFLLPPKWEGWGGLNYKSGNLPNTMAVVWTETFSAGIPAGWTNTGISDPDALWVYRGPATTPTNAVGGQGDCSGGTPINSPTKANGFIIFDSNYLDVNAYCGGGNAGTAASPQTSELITSAIDLTGHPNVVLKFYFFGRNYQGAPAVSVSGNGGATFTDVWTWTLAVNSASANPQLVNVNISAIAGNSANAKIKFTWDGEYYELMMDDISIEDAPPSDLTIQEKFYYTNYYFDSTSTKYYTRMPFRQGKADTLQFGAHARNNGASAQGNTQLKVTVTGAQAATQTSAPVTMQSASFDSLQVTSTFVPFGKGNHYLNFSVNSDSTDANPSDNSIKDTIIVTDTVYGRDNNKPASGIWYGQTGETYIIGNLLYIGAQDTATSVSVYILNPANPIYSLVGKVINFKLYDFNGTDPVEMASNDFYLVQSGDAGTWKTLTLSPVAPYTSLELVPGFYLVAFESQSDSVLFTIGQGNPTAPKQTSFVNISDDPTTWYYTYYIPFVRLNTTADPCAATFNPVVTHISCSGQTNGSINLTTTGSASPFTFSWNNGATTEDISSLTAANYSVTITGTGGCSYNMSFNIIEPAPLTVTATAVDALCGAGNGSVTAVPVGGTSPYTYLWNTSPPKTTATVTGLAAGAYTVTVTDSKGCTQTASVTLTSSPALTATITKTDATCGVADGSATTTITSGTSPYTYQWSNGQTTASITNLNVGTYTVTITDGAGCTATYSVNVINPNAPTGTVSSSTNVSCNGGNNGSINITVSGGTLPYTYNWSNGAVSEDVSSLVAGQYSVTVTDAGSCVLVLSDTITEPTILNASATPTNVLCNGASTGIVATSVSGGISPYTYQWSNGAGTANLNGVAAGNYSVTVTDANNCTKTASATVTEPPAITITGTVVDNQYLGSITTTVNGGTGNYTFDWSGPGGFTSIVQNISGLTVQGVYTLEVTDANGCTSSMSFTVAGIVSAKTPEAGFADITIFPNPNDGVFNVQMSKCANVRIDIYNVLGEKIYSSTLTSTSTSVDLSTKPKGMYFLQVSGDEINRMQKIIVR